MTSGEYVLMTVECAGENPRIDDAAAALSVPVSALDADFGLVPIDPSKHLYAVQILAAQAPKYKGADDFKGPFSNPRIETFGPPKTKRD